MSGLTHFNEEGRAKMVDVSEKQTTLREAVAACSVLVNEETFEMIKCGDVKKGDVLAVAQVAGIMAAKRTSNFIPMCHPVSISGVDISFDPDDEFNIINITATVRCNGETGVEMEALLAVTTAALTIYDMCKANQRDIEISNVRLLKKTGGKSGDYIATDKNQLEKKSKAAGRIRSSRRRK